MREDGPWALAADWLARSEPGVIVRVAAARGSTPREAGTWMLVGERQTAGTIGGGQLEWQAIARARALLGAGSADRPSSPGSGPGTDPPSPDAESGWPVPLAVDSVALGPALGQCCGGAVTLHHHVVDACADRLRRGPPPEPAADEPLVLRAPDIPPDWTVQLHGAGHVGQAVAAQLLQLGFALQWIDAREAPLNADAGAGAGAEPALSARLVLDDDPVARVAEAPGGSAFIVMTHSHPLDLEIVRAALARQDARFVGLIGSRTKRARFAARLGERGFTEAQIGQLVCPVGLPGVAGKAPQRIAQAIAAQLLELVHGPACAQADRKRTETSGAAASGTEASGAADRAHQETPGRPRFP